MKKIALGLTVASVALCSMEAVSLGQAEIVPEEKIAGATDEDIVGINPSLVVGGTLNLVNNTNVVGQVEGTSILAGLNLAGGVDYVNGKSVWRNQLTIDESFAKTPVVDRLIKTNDVVSLASSYNYFLMPKLGLFSQAKVTTSLFVARAVTADPQDYTINSAKKDGAPVSVTSDELQISSAFKPFTLGYSAGAFSEPLVGTKLTLRVSGGIGGRHTFASGVRVKNDDDDTPAIELQELANVHQAGGELFAGIAGKIAKDDRVSYQAGLSLLVPVINNDEFDRSVGALARIAAEGSITVGVFDWMGIVYKGSLVRDPQLFPDGEELTQFQNSLLLTFQYTLIDRQKGLVALKKEADLAQAKKEREEAVQRALEAEERAKQLEEELKRAKEAEANPPVEPTPEPDPNAVAPTDGTTTTPAPTQPPTGGTGSTP